MANQYRTANSAYVGDTTSFTARILTENHTVLAHASVVTGQSINLLVNQAVDEFVATHRHEWATQAESSYQDIIDKLGGK